MNIFNKYYNKGEAELKAGREPIVFKKVGRGFESAIDQMEEEKLSVEEETERRRIMVANGDVSAIIGIAEKLVELEDIRMIMKVLRAEKVSFVGGDVK